MKLKRKILLSTSAIIAVAAPVVVTISCSEKDKESWNNTDSNVSTSSAAIDINLNKELVFEGEDGAGSLQFQFKRGVIPMLSQANARLVVEIARYKESTILKDNYKEVLSADFSKLNKENKDVTEKKDYINQKLGAINNLMVEDKVRVTVSTPMKGYEIKDINPLNISGEKLKYEPLKPSEKLIDLAKYAIVNDSLKVNLDKYEKGNLNDVMLSIASGMGILLSNEMDVTLGNKDPLKTFTPMMLFEMIKKMKEKNIKEFDFSYTDKDGKTRENIFKLDQMKPIEDNKAGEIRNDKTVSDKINHVFEELDKIFNPTTVKTVRRKKEDAKPTVKPDEKSQIKTPQPKGGVDAKIKEEVKDIQWAITAANINNQYMNVASIADDINQNKYQKEIADLKEQRKDPTLTKVQIEGIDKQIQVKQDEFLEQSKTFKHEKIEDKLIALSKWTNVNLNKSNESVEITGILVIANLDHTVTIEVETTSKDGKKGYVYGTLIGKEIPKLTKGPTESDAEFQKRQDAQKAELDKLKTKIETRARIIPNIKEFQNLVSQLKFKEDNMTKLAVVVSEINKAADIDSKLEALEKWGNVSIPKTIRGTEITNIIANEDPITGKIHLNIETTSKDSDQNDLVVNILGVIVGKTNKQIDEIAEENKKQTNNINTIIRQLQNKSIKDQDFKYIKNIIDEINSIDNLSKKIEKINAIMGSNLKSTAENNTTITGIKIESKPTGEMKIIITTNTPGALVPEKDVTIDASGESDQVISEKIIKEINKEDKTITDQITSVKAILGIDIPEQQDGGKVVKIAAKLDEKGEVVIDVSVKAPKEIKASDDIDKVADKIKRLLLNSKLQERYKEVLKSKDNDLLLLIANVWDEKTSNTEALESLIDLVLTYSDIFNRLKEWEFFKDWVEQTRMRNLDKIDDILMATILRK
ncbi:hypothetical protein [Mycoplasma todarodis]|uniref:hypothetical protein n=1 Tax=Mycoplasma todarodis TaxID=1937191 RepID=UPI00103D95D1|nr:hypothetical protein [Mycoplasma todarodis]